jgi:hypothetical protein
MADSNDQLGSILPIVSTYALVFVLHDPIKTTSPESKEDQLEFERRVMIELSNRMIPNQ